MLHGKSGTNVGTSTFAKANNLLNLKMIDHCLEAIG
jgi:hypothetical protein